MSIYIGVVIANTIMDYTDQPPSVIKVAEINGKLYDLYKINIGDIKYGKTINPILYVDDHLTSFINIDESKIYDNTKSYVNIRGEQLVNYTRSDILRFVLLPKVSQNASKNLLNTIICPFKTDLYFNTDHCKMRTNCIPFLYWYHHKNGHSILPRIEMQLDEMIFRRLFRYNNDLKVQHDTFKSTSSNIEYLFLYYDYINTNKLMGTEDAFKDMMDPDKNKEAGTTPYIHTQSEPQFYTHNWVASKFEKGSDITKPTTNWFYNIIDPSSLSNKITITNNGEKNDGETIDSHIHIHNDSHSDASIMKINMKEYMSSTYYSFCIITQITHKPDKPDKPDNILYTYVIIDTKKEYTHHRLQSSLGIHGIKNAFKDLDVPYYNIINTLFPTIETLII